MSLIDAMHKRWSPRSFLPKDVEEDKLKSLFEAARWAPSSMNEQPWRYYYATKENADAFNRLVACLVPGNQMWAKEAPVLILSVAKKQFDYKNRPNDYAVHDTGAANAYLALQATHVGLQAHQMGGFDKSRAIELFQLDAERFEPVTVIALGYQGQADQLPDALKERELAPRIRLEFDDIVNHLKE